MSFIKRDWTPAEADRWTKHDFLACLFGVLAFFFVTIGVAGAMLLQVWGFVCVALAALCTWLTFWVIDPKLKTLSDAFEAKQDDFLDAVEKHNRWER